MACPRGVSVPVVPQSISLSKRWGPAVLETPGRGGRRPPYVTREAAQPFLAPVLQRAATGEMATIGAIHRALEAYGPHTGPPTTR
jgi:hypothetical protein